MAPPAEVVFLFYAGTVLGACYLMALTVLACLTLTKPRSNNPSRFLCLLSAPLTGAAGWLAAAFPIMRLIGETEDGLGWWVLWFALFDPDAGWWFRLVPLIPIGAAAAAFGLPFVLLRQLERRRSKGTAVQKSPLRKVAWTLSLAILVIELGAVIAITARAGFSKISRNAAQSAIIEAGGRISESSMHVGMNDWQSVYDLDFSGTDLNDEQLIGLLPTLETLERVRRINLRNTRVGNDGLSSLQGPVELDVTGSFVTSDGIARFRRKFPGAIVIDNGDSQAFDLDRKHDCQDLLFGPNGRRLVVVSRGEVLVFDLDKQSQVASFPGGNSVSFSMNGRLLAVAFASGAMVWDLDTQGEVLTLPNRRQSADRIAMSNDGKRLLVEEYKTTHQYSLETGSYVDSRPGILVGRSHNIGGLRFGEMVAAMIHPELGALTGKLTGTPSQINLGVVSADGRVAAWTSDPRHHLTASRSIFLVDLPTGEVIREIAETDFEVDSAITTGRLFLISGSFDATADRLAVGGSDGLVRVLDVKTGSLLFSHDDSSGSVTCVAISSDGLRVAAVFSGGSVKWWRIDR